MTLLTWRDSDLPKGDITPYSLISKMGDKGEGGVKNLKKWETSLMDGPLVCGCFSGSNEREV